MQGHTQVGLVPFVGLESDRVGFRRVGGSEEEMSKLGSQSSVRVGPESGTVFAANCRETEVQIQASEKIWIRKHIRVAGCYHPAPQV